ncbi:TraR/DksA C4-type zinc finger protein [Streptomyces sp. MJP52]|uniref:TraR/DksA family transcriptional regulator n=1 Tax=Streptomyces sp. MJP52 TaxID=2940555 RepID=UPI002474C608|nr:TraR/DksA C4-type zinc finger protein [Streptomyces sp. MJP52]MDH6226779.1 DnaK suppressor protein [Streptomyces sp. MJP52]
MAFDAAPPEPRPLPHDRHQARQRLEHERGTRLAQLHSLTGSGQTADDHLMSTQKDAITKVLREIEDAFARIEDGSYGTCLRCGEAIPEERLEILPYTHHCVGCRRRIA